MRVKAGRTVVSILNVRFAPTTAIKQECFYLTDALLLTDQSKFTNYNPWQGQGNLIVMQP
jgi:hypothetical protein